MSQIDGILSELITLLRANGEPDWAHNIEDLAAEIKIGPPDKIASRWLIIFGGMGSLSDLVLHSEDGQPLVHANGTLSSLRTKLHKYLLELRQSEV